eukprot:COSAG04_NODE_7398_length_1135_cov_1.322394_1_plen_122_part_00
MKRKETLLLTPHMPYRWILLDHLHLVSHSGFRLTQSIIYSLIVIFVVRVRPLRLRRQVRTHEVVQLLLGCNAGGTEAFDLGRRDDATQGLQAHGICKKPAGTKSKRRSRQGHSLCLGSVRQ